MYDYVPRESNFLANDELKMPRVDEFILLLEQELIEDVAVGAHLTAKYSRSLFEYDQLNLIYDEDGSQVIGSREGDPLSGRFRIRTPEGARRPSTTTARCSPT